MSIASNFPAIKPSLSLDFANTGALDPRITFTRSTTATYYDGVTTAKAEENLLTYSQEFDNAIWLKANASVSANIATAPDGTSTADSLVEDTATTAHYIENVQTLTSSSNYTYSCFAKNIDGVYLVLALRGAAGNYASATFNLSTGVVTSSGAAGTGFSVSSTSIVDVGNGWYRCVLSLVVGTTVSSSRNFISMWDGAASIGTSGIYVYTGTSRSIQIWGAQLEQRSSVTAYTATTTQPITNYIPVLQTAAAGQARFDHNPTTGESLGLLIEEQRTNICIRSDDFSASGWTLVNATVSANVNVAPDGTQTADLLIPNSTNSSDHSVYRLNGSSLTGTYTVSCYAKAAGYNFFEIFDGVGANRLKVDLRDGTYTTTGSPLAVSVTPVGNGWYRCSFTRAITAASQYVQIGALSTLAGNSFSGDGFSGVYIWGAQSEAGSFATSYIQTVASQVTRAADAASMTGTNFSSWYNAGEGTLYGEGVSAPGVRADGNSQGFVAVSDNTFNNRVRIARSNLQQIQWQSVSGGSSAYNQSGGSWVNSTNVKVASAYKINDFAGYSDGTLRFTATSGLPPAGVNLLQIGNQAGIDTPWGGTIKKIAYYPQALTAANLQALTS